jgi:hypothetical protein
MSIGEILDKISILELKSRYITDVQKQENIQDELSYLKTIVSKQLEYLGSGPSIYTSLEKINEKIWSLQDAIHDFSASPSQRLANYECIKDLNHARWRAKEKINTLFSSKFREMKSYASKKLLLFPHQGMGDQFTMVGAVRYLSLLYDEILLVVRKIYLKAVKQMYSDDASIQYLEIDDVHDLSPNFGDTKKNQAKIAEYEAQGYTYKGCVMQKKGWDRDYTNFLRKFYTDLGLNFSIRFDFGYIHMPTEEEKKTALRKILGHLKTYIFIHDHRYDTHHHTPLLLPKIQSDHFQFHPNDPNFYQSDNILDYAGVMENAQEIHIIGSSFFCMAHYLDLSKVGRLVLYKAHYPGYTDKIWESGK